MNKSSNTEPPPQFPSGGWFRDHLLSIILIWLFLISLVGQFYFSINTRPASPSSTGNQRRNHCPLIT